MKFFLLSLGVLCVHLALMGWLQVNLHTRQTEVALTPVQTRQILALSPEQPTATPLTHQRHEPGLSQATPAVTRNNVVIPASPSTMTTPKLDISISPPVTAGTSGDSDPSAKSDKSTHAATSLTEGESTGKTLPSTGLQLPSSHADYLNNPPPPYPALSLRLHEAGKVVMRVLIGKNGQALDGHVVQSSGFDRLDQAALKAALAWRYVPGKVDGQARDMWFDIPISFNLPN